MAISMSVVGLFMIKGHFGQVYKLAFIDVIEMACYATLGLLSTIKLKFKDVKIVSIATHISGVFIVLLLASCNNLLPFVHYTQHKMFKETQYCE